MVELADVGQPGEHDGEQRQAPADQRVGHKACGLWSGFVAERAQRVANRLIDVEGDHVGPAERSEQTVVLDERDQLTELNVALQPSKRCDRKAAVDHDQRDAQRAQADDREHQAQVDDR